MDNRFKSTLLGITSVGTLQSLGNVLKIYKQNGKLTAQVICINHRTVFFYYYTNILLSVELRESEELYFSCQVLS